MNTSVFIGQNKVASFRKSRDFIFYTVLYFRSIYCLVLLINYLIFLLVSKLQKSSPYQLRYVH